MIELIIYSVVAAAVAGLIIKFVLPRFSDTKEVTWLEYIVGMVLITIVIAPAASSIGYNMAKADLKSFQEYWNGWELQAVVETIACTKDGPCRWEYQCDSYLCNPHDCNCTCTGRDKDGNCTSESCQTCWDTCWHDCPYCAQEYNYRIRTTLGDYDIALNVLPDNPQGNRWQSAYDSGEWDYNSPIPQNILNAAGIGIPPFWQAANDRITADNPGPVTRRMPYDNYILASQYTILRDFSGAIQGYLDRNLLPPVVYGVRDYYYADKVSFVGYTPEDPQDWELALMYFDAALGDELKGDTHIVIVDANSVTNPDEYIIALKAHWQDPTVFGDNSLSKNGIIVVVGTLDGQTVAWARGTTGMPLGNELMEVSIREDLDGTPLTPDAVIGRISGEFYIRESDGKTKVRGLHGTGVLETILWGRGDPNTKFVRVSMTANDADDVGTGFLYLDSEIQPTPDQKRNIEIGVFVISLFVWIGAAAFGERRRRNW